jgi:hypothetical protein
VSRRSFAADSALASRGDFFKKNELKPETEICRCELVFVSVDEKGKPRPWNEPAK